MKTKVINIHLGKTLCCYNSNKLHWNAWNVNIVCLSYTWTVLTDSWSSPDESKHFSPHLKVVGFFPVSLNSAPSNLCFLWFPFSLLFFPLLSDPSSLEQGCFRFLLSPKPFSFGWSVKDSDDQRWEARRPAGEGAQEAARIYWAASGRRTIRQGRAMPQSAGRSGKDFHLRLTLMETFICRWEEAAAPITTFSYFFKRNFDLW